MKPLKATCTFGLYGAFALALATSACGGVTQFSDQAAMAIMGSLPPPPPPPPEEPAKPMRVELRDNSIVINEKIQFAYNDATILDVSFSLLDEVAAVIKSAPHVKLLEIGGHASTEGSDNHNMRLSDRRAKAVMTYLVEKAGVKTDLLAAKGYGETKPLADPEETDADRERNRRVEFLILEQNVTEKKVEIDPNTGKEKVLDQTMKTQKVETAAADEDVAPAEEDN
jgi:OOP family OmpA-OmpF porin